MKMYDGKLQRETARETEETWLFENWIWNGARAALDAPPARGMTTSTVIAREGGRSRKITCYPDGNKQRPRRMLSAFAAFAVHAFAKVLRRPLASRAQTGL